MTAAVAAGCGGATGAGFFRTRKSAIIDVTKVATLMMRSSFQFFIAHLGLAISMLPRRRRKAHMTEVTGRVVTYPELVWDQLVRNYTSSYSSFFASSSFTICGLAWPLEAFMTWPTKNPATVFLPAAILLDLLGIGGDDLVDDLLERRGIA